MWEIVVTEEFSQWWADLALEEQEDISTCIKLLENTGPHLLFPYSSGIKGAKHSHMRELRIQHKGRPYRVLYAFDPKRVAIMLVGGDKTGNDRWYDIYVPLADHLYDKHLKSLNKRVN